MSIKPPADPSSANLGATPKQSSQRAVIILLIVIALLLAVVAGLLLTRELKPKATTEPTSPTETQEPAESTESATQAPSPQETSAPSLTDPQILDIAHSEVTRRADDPRAKGDVNAPVQIIQHLRIGGVGSECGRGDRPQRLSGFDGVRVRTVGPGPSPIVGSVGSGIGRGGGSGILRALNGRWGRLGRWGVLRGLGAVRIRGGLVRRSGGRSGAHPPPQVIRGCGGRWGRRRGRRDRDPCDQGAGGDPAHEWSAPALKHDIGAPAHDGSGRCAARSP